MTFGGYDVGRSVEAPIETVMFRSPFFLAVNLMAFVMRLTRTIKSALVRTKGSRCYLVSCG